MKKLFAFLLVFALMFTVSGCVSDYSPHIPTPDLSAPEDNFPQNTSDTDVSDDAPLPSTSNTDSTMTVHVIDVGQGHAVLIESDDEFMLVDVGEYEYADTVKAYLSAQGVDNLRYAIATHPHSDHMGCYGDIIKSYPIGTFMMPNAQNNTTAFEKMLEALTAKNTPVVIPKVGQVYELGSVCFTILSPTSSTYSDLNDYSIGIRVVCGDMSFVVTGDATTLSESEMLDSGVELDSDVMLVPHHGSDSSSSIAFIKTISPSAAIISCGEDNIYGHPHDEVVARYNSLGIPLYRTDECGTITVSFTSTNYQIDVVPAAIPNGNIPETVEGEYIGNINSRKFHTTDCPNLPAEHNRIYFSSRDEAVNEGYNPCGNCNP